MGRDAVMAGSVTSDNVLLPVSSSKSIIIIKMKVEENDWEYCYLDGKTKDRQEQVSKFQNTEIPLVSIGIRS